MTFKTSHHPLTAAVCLSLSLASCTHNRAQKKFENALSAGRCEEALNTIPQEDPQIKFVGQSERAAGKVLSYSATGAGYAVDAVLVVVSSSVTAVMLCGPLIAAAAIAQSHGGVVNASGMGPCMPYSFKPFYPQAGKTIYKATAGLRCPDLTALSKSVRKVASCHETSNAAEGRERALTTLNALASNPDLMKCITEEERLAVFSELGRLEKIQKM